MGAKPRKANSNDAIYERKAMVEPASSRPTYSWKDLSLTEWKDEYFLPEFIVACKAGDLLHGGNKVCTEEQPGVFRLGIWTPEYCTRLCNEVTQLIETQERESGSYDPEYGVCIEDFGDFRNFFSKLIKQFDEQWIKRCIHPEAQLVFRTAFALRYLPNESLRMHVDESDFTLGICIGRAGFRGGELVLDCDDGGESIFIPQRIGTAIVHDGRRRHGASQVTSGERYAIIVWSKIVYNFSKWNDLPPELQSEIAGKLDARTLGAVLPLCSKAMYELANTDSLWKALSQKDFPKRWDSETTEGVSWKERYHNLRNGEELLAMIDAHARSSDLVSRTMEIARTMNDPIPVRTSEPTPMRMTSEELEMRRPSNIPTRMPSGIPVRRPYNPRDLDDDENNDIPQRRVMPLRGTRIENVRTHTGPQQRPVQRASEFLSGEPVRQKAVPIKQPRPKK